MGLIPADVQAHSPTPRREWLLPPGPSPTIPAPGGAIMPVQGQPETWVGQALPPAQSTIQYLKILRPPELAGPTPAEEALGQGGRGGEW